MQRHALLITKPILLATIVLWGQAALAETKSQSYRVTFESVATTCKTKHLLWPKGASVILLGESKQTTLQLPKGIALTGRALRAKRFRVSAKGIATVNKAVSARLSASGKADAQKIRLMLIAEYYKGKDSPVCSTTWKIDGKAKSQ